MDHPIRRDGTAGLHGSARDEDGGDIQPHRREQHPWCDLVTIGDADQGVRAVRVHHVLDRVGDQLATGQRIEHATVAHRDAVVHRDRVELPAHAAGRGDRLGDDATHIAQVHVARHELGEAVRHGHNRLAEVVVGHAGRTPERAGACHVASMRDRSRPQRGHSTVSS